MGRDGHKRPVILQKSKEATLERLAESPAFTSIVISSIWPKVTIKAGRIRAVNMSKIQYS